MFRILVVVFSLLVVRTSLWAQEEIREFEVGSLRFQGNDILTDDQLLSVIRTRQTPWIFWKFLYSISEKLGDKPEYYDPLTFESDFLQLRRYYEENGFYHARIDTLIAVDDAGKRVSLTFKIQEGSRSSIDSIHYRGLDGVAPDVLEEIRTNLFIEVGDPFVMSKVDAERGRIVNLFANNGYVNVKLDPPVAQRYASTNNFSIVFSVRPGKRYQFGDIIVQQDSAVSQPVDSSVVLRHLDFSRGDFYSESKKVESERNLNRLGIFDATKIENALPTLSPDVLEIPVRVLVRTRPFQELTPEIGLNDENNALNILTGIGYSHRNFLGGARNLSTRIRYNLQSIQTARLDQLFSKSGLQDSTLVSKLELSTQLVQPYFFNNKTSLSATLSAVLDKREQYYLPILQSRIGIAAQTATYTRAFVDWNLEYVAPTSVTTQQDTTLQNFERQFNSIITFTLQRDKRNDLFAPSEGFFHSVSVEEAGVLPKAFGGLFGSKLPFSQYIKFTGLAQWYWDPTLKREFIWATRLRGGAAQLYGGSSTPVPITRRFFSGGSGSVRGWKARELTAFPDVNRTGGTVFVEGNLEGRWNVLRGAGKFFFLDLEKISFVFFYDGGNVWNDPKQVRLSEVAMAAGFGIRYDTIAGPIRIDFGMKVYDPAASIESQWITQKRFFPETFSSGIIHFGVGHTF